MQAGLHELLVVPRSSIGDPIQHDVELKYLEPWHRLAQELGNVLRHRNGFYGFESSLLVRPFSHSPAPLGLVEWNASTTWKYAYSDDLESVLFFGEDVFGCQFCFRYGKVCTFDPETAQFVQVADSLEGWARIVMDDSAFRTGYPLSRAWQTQNHPLRSGTRLLPKVPFVLGGQYEVDNLYALDEVQGMTFRGSLSNQLRDVADGEQIVLDVVNRPTEGGERKE